MRGAVRADCACATPGLAFRIVRDGKVVDAALGARRTAALGLRNLIADRYGELDWRRSHELAHTGRDDRLSFCGPIERRAGRG
jgi:uncharacterized protein YutE (UPF0331/DUF86 family)